MKSIQLIYIVLSFFFLLKGFCGPLHVSAQQPEVFQVLDRLRASIGDEVAALPDVTCDEHLVSAYMHKHRIRRQFIIDSELIATRPHTPLEPFEEHRNMQTINGKPAPPGQRFNEDFHLPLLVSDGFGGTFHSLLYPDVPACFQYSALYTTQDNRAAIEVDIRGSKDAASIPQCDKKDNLFEMSFWISADDNELLRTHIFKNYDRGVPIDYNSISSDIAYTALRLGPTLTILPATVDAVATNGKNGDQILYHSQYGHCHRFVSTVTILPNEEAPSMQPRIR